MPDFSSERVISGQASRRYTSRYLGKSVAKEDSSAKVPPRLSAGVKGSIWRGEVSVRVGSGGYWDRSIPSTYRYHLYPTAFPSCE